MMMNNLSLLCLMILLLILNSMLLNDMYCYNFEPKLLLCVPNVMELIVLFNFLCTVFVLGCSRTFL